MPTDLAILYYYILYFLLLKIKIFYINYYYKLGITHCGYSSPANPAFITPDPYLIIIRN